MRNNRTTNQRKITTYRLSPTATANNLPLQGHWGKRDSAVCFIVALRPRKRDGLLGTGTELEGDDRVKARPRKPPEKDRRDRGPPPEQWKGQVVTNAEARCNKSLRPRKPEGSLGRTAQDVHLDSHTAPERKFFSD